MSVWPLIFTGEEICVATYSPDQNPVRLATSLTHQRRNLSVWLCNNLPEEKYTLSVYLAIFSPVSFWLLSHQCLFGHSLTSGHLHTRVCLATYSPVCLATYSPVSGHVHIRVCLATYSPVCLAAYSPVCVWPLTHQRRKGAVLWDVEHTLIHTQLLVEVLSVVY